MTSHEPRRGEHAVTTGIPPLVKLPASRWQRAAEASGIIALGMLLAAGVMPW